MIYNLTLSEEQAEILGYALTKARRAEFDRASTYKRDGIAYEGCMTRARRIEELRNMLDRAGADEEPEDRAIAIARKFVDKATGDAIERAVRE